MEKRIKDKKPVQLKLASMSENWQGSPNGKSGKHISQERQRRNKAAKRRVKQQARSKHKSKK